ncbi:MAG TPA: hypothetical protein VK663_13180 [Burkholderiales bacterium]|nr:hypothetical protein [Burkholderiales bacterium]
MNIHQIQMSYNAQEDRILLRVLSTQRAEFRFWLTRRYVKLLWAVLIKMLERDPVAAAHGDESVRRTMMGFQHANAVSGGEFAKPYEEGVCLLPLGANPVLLSRISGKQPGHQPQILSLHPEQGQGIDLGVNTGLLHMISKLLADAVAQADWDLKLAIDPDFAQPPQLQGIPPHKLN